MQEKAKLRIFKAISIWSQELQKYPGWREWKRENFSYTLNFDDPEFVQDAASDEFHFPPQLNAEHTLIISYLELVDTANALSDVEWYFRRYPFSRAPVTFSSHLQYCCEMYLGRFYQFKERLKNLSKAFKLAVPDQKLNFGKFIRGFEKEFDVELRARNSIHHHRAFDDVAIWRVALLQMIDVTDPNPDRKSEYRSHYRKAATEWASRAKKRSAKLDEFLEAIASVLLDTCPFLEEKKTTPHSKINES